MGRLVRETCTVHLHDVCNRPARIEMNVPLQCPLHKSRECVRNLDLRVQVHPGELWVSKKRVHIVLEASKSAGAKGDVPKICGFVHPLHPL